jgi:hypothetical protein
MYNGKVKIMSVTGIYKMFVSVNITPVGGPITQSPAVIVDESVTERNVFLLCRGELDSGHNDAVLSFKGKERYIFLIKFVL